MKTLKLLALIASLTLSILSVSMAQNNWLFGIGPEQTMTWGPPSITIGVSSIASDGYDSLDQTASFGTFPYNYPNMAIYHSSASGWSGAEGFYGQDIRQPMVDEKTWDNIYLWWEPNVYTNRDIYLAPFFNSMPPSNYRFTLYMDQVPNGISYNGLWSWELSPTEVTLIPKGTFTPYGSTTGLDSYKFHLTVQAVPEPSSLLALAGGLAGVGGMLLRKR